MSVTDRRSILRRSPLADRRSFIARAMGLSPIGDIAGATLSEVAETTKTWETTSDWDNSTSEAGVVHEGIGDYAPSDVIQLGYPSFDRGGTDLLYYYQFHESGGGTTVNDLSGNGNDAARNGSTQGVTGLHNSDAYNHEPGNNDYVDQGGAPQDNSCTVFLWYKADGTSFNGNAITFSQRSGNGLLHHPNSDPGDTVNYYVIDSGGSAEQVGNGGSSISDISVWNSYAFKYDDANNTAKGYVNGSVDVSDTSFSVSRAGDGTSTTAAIGKDETFSRYSDGSHAIVRLYNRALSDTEISNLHAAGTSGHLETGTKAFASTKKPNLQNLSYSLNGQTIDLKVIGSPGTASEEVVTQTLDGSTSYTLSWSSGHTDFRLRPEFSTTDVTVSPTFDRGEIVG